MGHLHKYFEFPVPFKLMLQTPPFVQFFKHAFTVVFPGALVVVTEQVTCI